MMVFRKSTCFVTIAAIFFALSLSGCSGRGGKEEADAKVTLSDVLKKSGVERYYLPAKSMVFPTRNNILFFIKNRDNKDVVNRMIDMNAMIVTKVDMFIDIINEEEGLVRMKPVGGDTDLWTFSALVKKK